MNSLPLQEYACPSADFDVLGDAGNGVITRDFLENDIAKWGVEQNLPDWIPALERPLTELDASGSVDLVGAALPANRFATYTTAYDGGTGGQTGFYNVMRNRGQSSRGPLVERELRLERGDAQRSTPGLRLRGVQLPLLHRRGLAPHDVGAQQGLHRHDRRRTQTVSWIRAMIDATPAWTNVETTDPGLLLPGDPQPASPPAEPYDLATGRILCED